MDFAAVVMSDNIGHTGKQWTSQLDVVVGETVLPEHIGKHYAVFVSRIVEMSHRFNIN